MGKERPLTLLTRRMMINNILGNDQYLDLAICIAFSKKE